MDPTQGPKKGLGRRQLPIIVTNFTAVEAVANKSGRKWWTCNHCPEGSPRIEGRDNNLLNHLADRRKCPNAPAEVYALAIKALQAKGNLRMVPVPLPDEADSEDHTTATGTVDGQKHPENASEVNASHLVTASKRKKGNDGNLLRYFDYSMTPEQEKRADVKFFRLVVHGNLPFNVASNWFLSDFVHELRPSYDPPSAYVLSHTLLDSEHARVHLEDTERLQSRERLTLLLDGWEDVLRRSLYGCVAAEVNEFPVVLSLDDLTGQRGNVETLLNVTNNALERMQLNPSKFVAVTTDNPTTMRAYRARLSKKFWWLLTFACFLHGLNTTIGEISGHTEIKKVISQATQVVTFFNSSHFWGGQLKEEAKRQGIKTSLKQNCESRWYALILHCMSVQTYRDALTTICVRRDAQKSVGGLSIIPQSIRDTVLSNALFWPSLNQLIKTTKPLVDAIGNLESRQATLADCMLELIRCARTMTRLELVEDDDNVNFWMHAKAVFNRRFHEMDTEHHSLALFLHPLCRKLAISQVANGRSHSLERDFAWVPPLTLQRGDSDADTVDGPEGITGEELDRAFDEFERELRESRAASAAEGDVDIDGSEVLEGNVYDFVELDNIDKGVLPKAFEDDLRVADVNATGEDADWEIDVILASAGIAS